jgi:hypothetical protein
MDSIHRFEDSESSKMETETASDKPERIASLIRRIAEKYFKPVQLVIRDVELCITYSL